MDFFKDLNLNAFENDAFWVNTNEDAIKFAIENIVMTNKGEHLTDPYFGVGVKKFLFENIGDDFLIDLEKEIEYQIETYEPRVILMDVKVEEIEDHKIAIYIYYKVKQTNVLDNVTIILNRKI